MKEIIQQLNELRPLFAREDKLKYAGLLVLQVIGAFLDVVGLGAIPAFVATLAVPDKVLAYPYVGPFLERMGITAGTELVLWGAGVLLVAFLIKNAYLMGVFMLQVRVTEYHLVRMTHRLFSAYMRAPYTFHLNRNSAELLRNVNLEAREVVTGVVNPLLQLTMAGMMTLFTVLLLVVATPSIAVVGIALIGGGNALFLRIVRTRLREYGIEARTQRKESIKAINQGLGALADAQILGREEFFVRVFHRSMMTFAYVNRLRQVINKSAPHLLESLAVLGILGIATVLILGGTGVDTLVPTLALFGAAVLRLRGSVGQVVGAASQIQYSVTAIPNVVADLAVLEPRLRRLQKIEANADPIGFDDAIRLDRVTYWYPDTETPALKDIDLTIRKGESVAFVGSTGSGKSTLVNVILGLLDPQEGSVLVDGRDIRSNPRGWLNHVGYVPQQIYLIDDTIAANIALGLDESDIDDERLQYAISAAQLRPFIDELPNGVETTVGERGVRISGGQRQRIGLARALYNQPDVLVMDEATSALDNRTENLVMEAVETLREEVTMVIVAHRLSTVRDCDRLYFLAHGQLESSGTYDDLVRTHAAFREMAEVP